MLRNILFFIAFFLSFAGYSQTEIQIFDAKTKESIPFAHLRFYSVDSTVFENRIADINGHLSIALTQKMKVCITYVGCKNFIEVIEPNKKYQFFLESTALCLDQVVITGQYTPQGTDKSIYKIKVIDSKEISLRGSTNLEDILSSESNMQIKQDGVFGSSLSMLGVGGENIKILVDGVPLIGRMNGELDLSQINLSNVERIEIVEGPMSVNYGSNALGGVINIITKNTINGSFNANIRSYYETVGRYNFDGDAGFSKGRSTVLVSGGRNFNSGFDAIDTLRSQQWKPKEQYFAKVRYKYQLGATSLRITSDYFREFVLDKGNPELAIDTTNNYYYFRARDGYYYTTRFNNQLSWNGVIHKKQFINFIASNSYYERLRQTQLKNLYTQDLKPSQATGDNDTSIFNSWLIKAEFSKLTSDTSKFNYQLGAEINLDKAVGEKIENNKQTINDYAVYGGFKYQILPSLSFQPAIRYSYNTEYNAPITPSINLKYDPSKFIQIRASYAKGFRSPSLKELYLDFVDLNHKIFGNTAIKAERSDNFSLNGSLTKNNGKHSIRYEADLFYNNISDMIDLFAKYEVSGGDTTEIFTYGNIDRHISQGGRLNLRYKRLSSLEFKISLAVIGEKSFSNTEKPFESNMNYHPEISSSIKILLLKTNINLLIVYKYSGSTVRNALDANNQLISYLDQDYHNLDISFSRDFFNEMFSVNLGGKNLFNVMDIKTSGPSGGVHGSGASTRPVGWGRTFFLSIAYHFNQ